MDFRRQADLLRMTTNRETKFVVLTAQRSGSTWFIDILNNLADSTAYTELFLPQRKPRDKRMLSPRTAQYIDEHLRAYPLFWEAEPLGFSIRPFSVVTYLHELYRRPGTIGFKLMYSNIVRYPEVWVYIALRRLHVVHLVRQNHLDVAISEQMRRATQTYHRIVDEPAPAPVSIELHAKDLVKQMRRSQRNIKIACWLLRMCRLPHIEVTYEDLVRDSHNFDAVFEFLSINRESGAPQSQLAKLVRRNHSEIISNYAEVKDALAATEFAALLNDPPDKSAQG